MKRFTVLLLLAGLVAWQFPAAQPQTRSIVVNGKVTSFEESFPLEGASVVVKGTSNATGTQADGTFSLLIGPGDSVLVVSLNGYEPKEIKASARNKQYDIVLKRSDKNITALLENQPRPATHNYMPMAPEVSTR
ncbi:MAG TPA: carboxypeptidase-like regulatory domain-containing protein [Chitinophagaceae bacterium]|nr:carboxypeptidase-like regulatory domain-containing protein [Chitinophagaceae bacterium]